MSFKNKSLAFDLTNEGLDHCVQFYYHVMREMLANPACLQVCSQNDKGFANYNMSVIWNK